MTIETWIALCPHCGIVWPVYSKTDTRIEEHPSGFLPGADYQAWNKEWERVSQPLLGLLQPGDPFATARIEEINAERARLLREWDSKKIRCKGSLMRAPGQVALNGSAEANAMVSAAIEAHGASGRVAP